MRHLLNTITGLFVLIAVLTLPFTLWYSQDRNVWDLQIITHQTSYTAGDEVKFTSIFESFVQQNTTFTNRFVCRNGIEKRQYIDDRFIQIAVTPQSQSDDKFIIPENFTGHSCTLENTASSCVDIGFGLHKCIVEVTDSNEFAIK